MNKLLRLSQNFSFWESYPRFIGKKRRFDAFSIAFPKTNRVLGKALLCVFALLVFLPRQAFCDPQILHTYMRNFSIGDLPTKIQILEDAAIDSALNGTAGQFFEYTLDFALSNFEILGSDPDLHKLINIAAGGLMKTGYIENPDILWDLFLKHKDSNSGADILIALGRLAGGNLNIVNNINDFLSEENFLFRSGKNVNYAVISAGITAIMELGDSSSYHVLLEVICTDYPEVIRFEAHGAIELIPGNLFRFLQEIIEKGLPAEKLTAFTIGSNSERLSFSQRGQLAELALEQSLVFYGSEENPDITDMRYAAVLALIPLRWSRAAPLAIRHYYRMQTEYQHDLVSRQHFIEAIELLGAVGNLDAALALGLQLGLINARTQRTGEFDTYITLAIVKALGNIGDNYVFDHLLYIKDLPYPEDIQIAAREAIENIRW